MSRQESRGFVGEKLGQFVAASRWDALPHAVRHAARRSLLNFVGCAIGVAHTPPIDMAMRVLTSLSGAERVTVLGRAERLDLLGAAFINAVSANLLDYDDTHLPTVIHPTAPVAPAALALAEQRGRSGAAMLHAFILGAEVACRIGNAVSPGHYARGWHITSTCGVFGSAVASAGLLGLDAQQTWHAIGIAASQSAGLVENLPSAAKNVGVGNAARNGLFAALLAEQGYTAAPAAFEGSLGWARAMGDDPAIAKVTDGLGTQWELLRNAFKPYPCGIVMHAVIDACLALRREHAVTVAEIAEIIVSGDQLLLDRGDRAVANDRDARVSIHHCAAVSFLFGAAGLKEFSEDTVHDPAVVALRALTKAQLNADTPRGAATAMVRTVDGRMLESTVLHARGSMEQPLSDRDIEAKVRELARHGAFRGSIDDVIAAVWQLDTAATIAPLLEALRRG
ncbi:MAG TPA: MmgE/PrpD family protein [Acetobacteraceae bacterium]|nr:MmgE/PrpD family protein [Acetobacteraceae bacterium]